MVKNSYFWELTNEKSSILAKVFELSVKEGYSSKKFVEAVMTNEKLAYLINEDNVPDWCDGYFLIATFSSEYAFEKGKTISKDKMWFLGYLYKYWMKSQGMPAKEVYKILPYDRYLSMYDFYHTQGWNYIIQDATEVYKNKSYIV